MHREVYALLYNDNKDAPPLMQTDTGSGYKQVKARLGMKNVRKWEWTPFENPARTDGAVFHHWRRVADDKKEYPFAKFNKKLNIVAYSGQEYNTHLRNTKWSKTQTDHLFELARRFDLRFVVMADRWDRSNHGTKTVEDLKERYYEVVGILAKVLFVLRMWNVFVEIRNLLRFLNYWNVCSSSFTQSQVKGSNGDKKPFVFDADHERKRKDQMKKLLDRSQKDIEEEQMLLNELKKIEARKKERDRKTQDLQKLISQADQVSLALCGIQWAWMCSWIFSIRSHILKLEHFNDIDFSRTAGRSTTNSNQLTETRQKSE